ncbi:hypothetical protein [Salinarimonas sp.]|uniref:hypothetical protein n=1 Tax=Salinarimonas sp. TaxID=2766526 RepID=UPI0032D8B588
MTDARARAKALSRIAAVQAQKRRLEEWKLADFHRRARAVAEAEAQTLAAMGEGSALHGLFVAQAAKRLDSLGRQRRSLEGAIERQGEAVRAEARREKAAEALLADAARRAEEERRRRADLEILEAMLARDAAEPGPL